jgi:general secretion pathway protein G
MKSTGFTLIEIMAVVVILGLLLTLAGPKVIALFDAGQRRAALAKCADYHGSVKAWLMVRAGKRLPSSLEELEQPLHPGDEENFIRVVADPWGNDYRIVAEGRRKFRIFSDGPDGEQGTADDICYEPLDEN